MQGFFYLLSKAEMEQGVWSGLVSPFQEDFCCVLVIFILLPDLRPLQFCRVTPWRHRDPVLVLLEECPAAACDMLECSGIGNASSSLRAHLPPSCQLCSPAFCCVPPPLPSPAAYADPYRKAKPGDRAKKWGNAQSPHYLQAQCLWSTGWGGCRDNRT